MTSGSRIVRSGRSLLVLVLVAGLTSGVTAAQGAPPRPAAPAKLASVPGRDAVAKAPPADATHTAAPPGAAVWPAAGTVEVALPAVAATGSAGATASLTDGSPLTWAAGLPVGVRAAASRTADATANANARVRIAMLDRASANRAGRDLVMRVGRTDTTASTAVVGLDYSRFRDAYGADWARRLRLTTLPECALRTPELSACQATDLVTSNDTVNHVLTAPVAMAATGTLVALAAGPSSDGGDYKATDLKASGVWSAGGNGGGFSWGYPLRLPPSLSGPAPNVQFSYSAQAVDGQTAATNAQPSWLGEGFAWQPGSIERGYRGCNDDGQSTSGDLCWAGDNASLTLNGTSTTLVYDSGSGSWRPKEEDGSRIERLTDTGLNNGDNDGEYWKLTATDGTQYFFGLNRLPGFRSGTDPETNSVYFEPVYGNNVGEPCNSAGGFGASSCQQAYRWNLDYVLDPHGNSMSLFYQRETNRYARNRVDADVSTYVRGGWLSEVDYGTRQDAGVDSVFAGTAAAQVQFTVTDRCLTAGAACTLTGANAANWPDVPVDQVCTTATCPGKYSPTFFTAKKLSAVTTRVASGAKSWRRVEQWRLSHDFKDPGDGLAKILWLRQIDHCGLDDTTCTPPVVFTATQMSNRVDKAGTTDSIIRYRIRSILTDSGGLITVSYSAPECVAGSNMPASPDTNTKRCFPAYWMPVGATTPKLEYFHKYVVTAVSLSDEVGGTTDQVTSYQYPQPPAWHYDDNPLALPARRTWGQWRGYDQVRVIHGDATETQSRQDVTYFRGMDGDRTATGTRSVSITDSDGGTWTDSDWFAGMTRESITYLGTGGTVVAKTKSDPYRFGPTATQVLNGVTMTANVTATAAGTTTTVLDHAPGTRVTRTVNTYAADRTGRVVQVDDQGDVATAADDRCTRTTYAANAAGTLLTLPARVETVGVACAATPDRSVDVISDVRTWYDGATGYGTTVVKGDVTRTEQLAGYNGGSPVYRQVGRAGFDVYGRVLDAYDALDHRTSTAYTPASGGPVTRTVATNAKGWTTTTDIDPAWGVKTATVDQNANRTDLSYDGLGRLTGVWLPGRDKAGQTPDQKYTYTVRNATGPSSIAAAKLNPAGTGYITSYTLYDGWLRERQVQGPAEGGGRTVAETLYDSRGLAVKSRPAYFNSSAPGTTLFVPTADIAVPAQTVTTYDGAERPTVAAFQVNAVQRWQTTTAYGGDHTDVSVPAGGTGTSTWTDARGQEVAVWQYHGNLAGGTHDVTTRTYTRAGDLATVTDPAGNRWTAGYDQRRRRTSGTDPNRGAYSATYDDADQALTVTDGRGVTLAFAYDELGRKTGEYQTSTSGARLASWTFDTLPNAKGRLSASTRYDADGNAYVSGITGYNGRYQQTGSTMTLPAAAGALAGTYTTAYTYNADGGLATATSPVRTGTANFGGLTDETLRYGYDSLGKPTTLSGLSTYVTGTEYQQTGELSSVAMTDGSGKSLLQYWTYEPGTGRLAEHQTVGDFATVVAADTFYSYDAAGNVTAIADKLSQRGAGPDDTQCLRYDYLRQLTDAWTPANGNCTTNPSTGALGGPAPYWTSYGYTATGDRTSEVKHASSGNTTNTYAYPASGSGAVRPHSVSSVTSTGAGSGTSTFGYDGAGNTVTRNVAGKPGQTLTWDAEGHLAGVADSATTTSYVYTASGNRLLAKTSTATTLTLGDTECRSDSTGVSCTRTYQHGDAGAVGVRTPSGLSWQTGDHQGTTQYSFRATDLSITQRRTTPFGEVRGMPPAAWPSSRGFVGGVDDQTGLEHVGAREYDKALGRFVSVDPVFAVDDPQSWHGYAYADNTPVSASDPTGLRNEDQYYGPGGKDKDYDSTPTAPPSGGNEPCDTHHSASNCHSGEPGSTPSPKPHDVMRTTIYPHGTVLIVHYDGTVSINGYVLPGDSADPDELARRLDDRWNPEDGPPDTLVTPGNIAYECGFAPTVCSKQLKDNAAAAHQKIVTNAQPGMVAFCFGGGGMTPQGGGGASFCLAHDQKGWGGYVTFDLGTKYGIPGAMVGAGIAQSNGSIADQSGWFFSGNGGGSVGIAVDMEYARWGSTQTVTTMVGLGSPGPSAAGGMTYTVILWGD
ncbi:RHS repeat domain-containing protein [Hamadaea tsunoensis]|uniref:RHS repeat domain-containing protein n=1 Tax=Hamadaea tsunoensis TaxID=53368 RepID=UPI0004132837|nr:RHS repeat-associated core domain-containing protein [Hamadaea tsunoensis]